MICNYAKFTDYLLLIACVSSPLAFNIVHVHMYRYVSTCEFVSVWCLHMCNELSLQNVQCVVYYRGPLIRIHDLAYYVLFHAGTCNFCALRIP